MASSHTNLSRTFVFLVFIHFVLCHICNGAYHGATLFSGENLHSDENLVNGPYSLVFKDCRLELLHPTPEREIPCWESRETRGEQSRCSCSMQYDGNLVVRGSNDWAALEKGEQHGAYVLVLRYDRDMAIYGPALWSSGAKKKSGHYAIENHAVENLTYKERRYRGHILYSDAEPLRTRDYLRAGNYMLEMNRDCNLEMYLFTYQDVELIWSTNTAGAGTDCYLQVGQGGTLRLYNGKNQVKWSANTTASHGRGTMVSPTYVFALRNDGDMLVYDSAIWHTDTTDPYHPKYPGTTTATNGIAAVV